MMTSRDQETILKSGQGDKLGESCGEDLAIARCLSPHRPPHYPMCSLAEAARRDTGGAVEGADEIGEIAEADIEGDVGDRPAVLGKQARGVTQAAAQQILMRCHAEAAGE